MQKVPGSDGKSITESQNCIFIYQNDLTGEHSCIMLKMLNEEDSEQEPWLIAFWKGNSDPADSARTPWAVYYSGGPLG